MIRHPDSNLQIAEKIELALSSQNKRVNTEGTNIVTNEFNREDYVINKAQTAEKFESHELSLQSLQESKQDVLTAGNGIDITNDVISAEGGSTSKKLTFSNSGNGAASGSTFDGSAARTLSYNSIGAAAENHSHPELLPVGTIVPYAGRTAPTGWLLCNGQAVSKTDYSALFDVIGYTYSSSSYQKEASSSYPNPNTTHFQVPDLRESVPVGIGTASSAKYWRSSNTTTSATSKTRTQRDTYILGQFKDDALQGHYHAPLSTNTTNRAIATNYGTGGSAELYSGGGIANWAKSTGEAITDGTNGTPRIDSVTRGKRFGVNYIIKY